MGSNLQAYATAGDMPGAKSSSAVEHELQSRVVKTHERVEQPAADALGAGAGWMREVGLPELTTHPNRHRASTAHGFVRVEERAAELGRDLALLFHQRRNDAHAHDLVALLHCAIHRADDEAAL